MAVVILTLYCLYICVSDASLFSVRHRDVGEPRKQTILTPGQFTSPASSVEPPTYHAPSSPTSRPLVACHPPCSSEEFCDFRNSHNFNVGKCNSPEYEDIIITPTLPTQLTCTLYFNKDEYKDILIVHYQGNLGLAKVIYGQKSAQVNLHMVNSTELPVTMIFNLTAATITNLVCGDWDGDNNDDLLLLLNSGRVAILSRALQQVDGESITTITLDNLIVVPLSGLHLLDVNAFQLRGDFNGDGSRDLLIGGTTTKQQHAAFVMYQGTTAEDVSIVPLLQIPLLGLQSVNTQYCGDMNSDNITDLLVSLYSAAVCTNFIIYGNTADKHDCNVTFSLDKWNTTAQPCYNVSGPYTTASPQVAQMIAPFDFNGDSFNDLLFISHDPALISILFGPTMLQRTHISKRNSSLHYAVPLGDVNSDGCEDALVAWTHDAIGWFVLFGTNSTAVVNQTLWIDVNYTISTKTWKGHEHLGLEGAVVTDFNGDSVNDFVIPVPTTHRSILFLGQQYSNVTAPPPPTSPPKFVKVVVGIGVGLAILVAVGAAVVAQWRSKRKQEYPKLMNKMGSPMQPVSSFGIPNSALEEENAITVTTHSTTPKVRFGGVQTITTTSESNTMDANSEVVIGKSGTRWFLSSAGSTNGKVVKGMSSSGQLAAIKTLPTSVGITETELKILKCLPKHPNLVQLIDMQQSLDKTFIVMEWLSGTTLDSIKKDFGGKLSSAQMRNYVSGILNGLDCLHTAGIIHRDIKPGSVLVTALHVLTEMGISKSVQHSPPANEVDISSITLLEDGLVAGKDYVLGTPQYMAPETMMGTASPPQDVWALGILIIELMAGSAVWIDETSAGALPPSKVLYRLAQGGVPQYQLGCSHAKSFVQQCLTANPLERPGTTQLLQHEWLHVDEKELDC